MGPTSDQPLRFQSIDSVCHARRVHLEPITEFAERHQTAATEFEDHQKLVTSKCEIERAENFVDSCLVDLLGAHDRGNGRDAWRGRIPPMSVPLTARFFDRIEVEASHRLRGSPAEAG